MEKITPFLWYDDKAEEAANFYTSIFKNSRVLTTTRYGESGPGPKGTVMTVAFELDGRQFAALNGGPLYSFTPAISFFVKCETQEEIETLWGNLSGDGTVLMDLAEYPFSAKFGWVMDRFGVSWQLNLSGTAQAIDPFLMFVGEQHGRAEEAMRFYVATFNNSRIIETALYGRDDPEPEGTVKHAVFSLDGREFMVSENSLDHAFTFTPATSFFVQCETQIEIDTMWEKLSEGSEKGRCGWLTDKFGVSWQVIPSVLGELLHDPDPQKSERVMDAMLKMDKLDIATLKEAHAQ